MTLKFPQPSDVVSYLLDGQRWHWTAHFEGFVSRFALGDRPRATPAGTYRFVVDGHRRQGRAVQPYSLASRRFEVRAWRGITVGDARLGKGRRASFRLGPRSVSEAKGGSQPVVRTEIGPVDYPDTYKSSVRFIDGRRSFVRDPKNPAIVEWYCLACSFRPWADSGDAKAVAVELVAPDGGRARVAAKRSRGRWVASRAVPRGGYAYVPPGCVRDPSGNLNGRASKVVGRGRARGSCAGARPRVVRCSSPRGRLRGKAVGAVALGRTRAGNRAALLTLAAQSRSVDRFCLAGKRRVRVAYLHGKAIAAVTSSPRYRAFGRRPGARARGLAGRSVRTGGTRWIVRRGRAATVLFKLRRGRVAEVGLAGRRLSHARLVRTLRSLR